MVLEFSLITMSINRKIHLINLVKNYKSYSTLLNRKYSIVEPYPVSAQVTVSEDVAKPAYWKSGVPDDSPAEIEIKTQEQISVLRDTCQLARRVLRALRGYIKVGMTTDEIDVFVHRYCIDNQAYPSPLNYLSFPKSICTSVNNVVCHGIPDKRPLQDGDVLNVDVTVFKNGMHGDCSAMFFVGTVDDNAKRLCYAAKEALEAGISVCKPGQSFSLIGKTIEKVVKSRGFAVVPAFLGHGIGSYFHGPPDIYHFDVTGTSMDMGAKMATGMSFTIEPALSEGGTEVVILEDGWTAVTSDNSRTAQWEHTVLITDNGVEILT